MGLYTAGDSSQPAFSLFCSLESSRQLSLYFLLENTVLQAVLSGCSINFPSIAHLLQIIRLIFYFTYQYSHLHQISFLLSYESTSCDSSPLILRREQAHIYFQHCKRILRSACLKLVSWDPVLKLPRPPHLGLSLLCLSLSLKLRNLPAFVSVCLCIFLTS